MDYTLVDADPDRHVFDLRVVAEAGGLTLVVEGILERELHVERPTPDQYQHALVEAQLRVA